MLTIRLTRIGKKNQPKYRLVLTDHTFPPKGKFIEILGSFDPRNEKIEIKKERVEYWLKQGSKVSQTVKELLKDQKVQGKLEVLNRKDRAQVTRKGAEVAKPAPIVKPSASAPASAKATADKPAEAPAGKEEKKEEDKKTEAKKNETPAKPEEKKEQKAEAPKAEAPAKK